MKIYFNLIVIFLFISNCTLNKVIKHHGVHFLEKKNFLNLDSMQNIKFTSQTTENQYKKNTFVYEFLSSMRQKINDPLGKRDK